MVVRGSDDNGGRFTWRGDPASLVCKAPAGVRREIFVCERWRTVMVYEGRAGWSYVKLLFNQFMLCGAVLVVWELIT